VRPCLIVHAPWAVQESAEHAPISGMFSREDVDACLPGHMGVLERRRFEISALDVVGLSAFQAIQFANLLTTTPAARP